MNLRMRVRDCDTETMVHCNKRTVMRALASVAIDHEEVYLYTDGGKERGNGLEETFVYSFVAKRHRLIKNLEVLLQPRAVHKS